MSRRIGLGGRVGGLCGLMGGTACEVGRRGVGWGMGQMRLRRMGRVRGQSAWRTGCWRARIKKWRSCSRRGAISLRNRMRSVARRLQLMRWRMAQHPKKVEDLGPSHPRCLWLLSPWMQLASDKSLHSLWMEMGCWSPVC